jgi:hypothetical protein
MQGSWIKVKKHQLCYWHAITYVKEWLAEDKPLAKYDPWKAHTIFCFINPTWAPGVMSGWLEDGVHEDDTDIEESEHEIENSEPVSIHHYNDISYLLSDSPHLHQHACLMYSF